MGILSENLRARQTERNVQRGTQTEKRDKNNCRDSEELRDRQTAKRASQRVKVVQRHTETEMGTETARDKTGETSEAERDGEKETEASWWPEIQDRDSKR